MKRGKREIDRSAILFFLEQIPLPALFLHKETILLNSQTEKLTGYNSEEISGLERWIRSVHPDEEFEEARQVYLSVTEGTQRSSCLGLSSKSGQQLVRVFSNGKNTWLLSPVERAKKAESVQSNPRTELLKAQHFQLARQNEAFVQALDEIAYDNNYLNGTIKWGGAFKTILGYSKEEMGSQATEWEAKISQNDTSKVLSELERARKERSKFNCTYCVKKKDGEIAWLHDVGVLQFDEEGNLERVVGIIRDITNRKNTEDRFRQFVELAPDAMLITDNGGDIQLLNTQAEKLFGYKRTELFGQPVELLVPQRYRNSHVKHKSDYLAEPSVRPMGHGRELYARHKDGHEFPVEVSLSPIKLPNATMVAAGIRDISDQKKVAEHQTMLMAELDHRVKNTLNIVLSIAQQMLRRSTSLEAFKEGFVGRISALADVHRLLTMAKWEGVSLYKLAHLATRPHLGESSASRLVVEGPNLTLAPKYAQAIYLALHELATNASKYGALSVSEGCLKLVWEIIERGSELEDPSILKISWEELDGPIVSVPKKKGFGSRLLERTISYELGGNTKLDFAASGLNCEISIPFPQGAILQEEESE